jgi:phospholipid-binding lipoprotein MlaA
VLDPLTRAYDAIGPEPVEPAIRRSFQHFGSASILLNDLLQLHFRNAADTSVRIVVNTTVGVFGLFDFARCEGFVRHNADFGQTLADYGVPSGPYLMLPVLGPSDLRDAFGDVVDALLHPARYWLGPAQAITYGSSSGLATRERHYHLLNELEKSAVDFYAALRNAFYQARMAEIEEQVDRDLVGPRREEYQAPCTATLAGHEKRVIGPRNARGLSVSPVSRWSPSRTETR